jgi:hypothetical protein
MRYLKVGMIEGLDLSAVVLVQRQLGGVNVALGAIAVQFAGEDADAFLAAWRSYVEEMDGPIGAIGDVRSGPAPGGADADLRCYSRRPGGSRKDPGLELRE